MEKMVSFEDLKGKIFNSITLSTDDDYIMFKCYDGTTYKMYHDQECCENVFIESINGDIFDLLNTEILEAIESTHSDDENKREYKKGQALDDSTTWTFYKLATIKGWVDIRWVGTSNGYYSEDVDIVEVI